MLLKFLRIACCDKMRLFWRVIVFLAITIMVVYIAVFFRLSEIVLYKGRSFRGSIGGP